MSFIKTILIKYVLPLAEKIAPRWVEKIKVNLIVGAEKGRRPHPFSLWSGMGMAPPPEGATAPVAKPNPESQFVAGDPAAAFAAAVTPFGPSGYVSWPGLADRRYTGRHLAPQAIAGLPTAEEVVDTLFLRAPGQFVPSPQSSTLFCFFAQWFTDSFLRTDPIDRRRNTSNHEIDYCQIYGLDERTTFALREGQGGRMRLENGLLPRLADADGAVRPEFAELSYVRNDAPSPANEPPGTRLRNAIGWSLTGTGPLEDARWQALYAAGLDRGNSTILYTAISTMCLREHNRVAGEIARRHPGWDDDRLFETTRIVMIRNVLTIVVENYINHLTGGVRFKLDRSFAEKQNWYRSNRISLEFNLLYRWHSLVPDKLTVAGKDYLPQDYRFNNALLERLGVEECINAASTQPAGRIGLYNTPPFLKRAEMATLDMARTFELQPFVAYCERFSVKPPQSIAELTGGDARATADLTRLYGSVERVELPVGLIAQGRESGDQDAVLPPLIRAMVAVDAFTHIFTNPLLAGQVHKAAFEGEADALGDLIDESGDLAGLMRRSARPGFEIRPSFDL